VAPADAVLDLGGERAAAADAVLIVPALPAVALLVGLQTQDEGVVVLPAVAEEGARPVRTRCCGHQRAPAIRSGCVRKEASPRQGFGATSHDTPGGGCFSSKFPMNDTRHARPHAAKTWPLAARPFGGASDRHRGVTDSCCHGARAAN